MVLSATPKLESEAGTSSPMSSARVQSVQSSAPPSMRSGVTATDMSHRTPSEQAVIQALQAVANYPDSRDFVETVSRQMPGLQNLLGRRGQQEGCLTTREGRGPSTDPLTPSTSATRNRAPSPISGLSPVSDEEIGRKRASPHELAQSVGNNDSPVSRPPPDKCNNVLRSVVIQDSPKVGYHGISEPQVTMKEVMERHAPSPASVPESTDNSVHSSSSTAKSRKKFTGPPYFPQSDNVSASVVTRDANRIWQVAPKLNDRQYRDRQGVPPTNTHQAQLRKLSVIVYVTRTLRPFDADTDEAAWEQRVIRRLTTTHDNYLRPMQNNLHEQCKARYSLRPGETWETHSQYPRSLKTMKPMSKEAIQRKRYCVMVDSTAPCDFPLDNVFPDVLVVTMPLSQLPEMAEVAIALFSPEGPQGKLPPSRTIFDNLMDHMACEGLLENLPHLLREMSSNETARNEVIKVLHRVTTAMERTAELLRTHLKVPAMFVSPPGMLYWGGMFQQIVYMLTEICSARNIEFYLCAPNLRVGKDDLRPAAVSVHAYLAVMSRLLQPVERGGNAQLTWDDAIFFDHGMYLGTLTFDETGTRLGSEATIAERENMRRYNWLVHEAHPNTIKADLAVAWDQLNRWPLNREVERTIPQIQFADNTELIKMPLGIRHIVAHEAVTFSSLVQAKEATYGDWYNDRLATVTLELTARTLSVSFQALLTSFGLGWHVDVIADKFNLTDDQLQRLTETLKETSVNEVLALALALGPTKFVAGPLAIVVDLVTSDGVLEFYTYLVLAQGKLTSLLGC